MATQLGVRLGAIWSVAAIALSGSLVCRSGQTSTQPAEKAMQVASENRACLVCHGNYAAEPLALDHARAGVACAQCHGKSIEHCGNEENIVPPDIMYPKDKINSSCRKCHPVHKAALQGAQSQVCTDCHGKHRLRFRTKVWDKATGKLLRSQ